MRTIIVHDRRTRRSDRPDQALYLQLDTVRDEAGLDALVLATEEGLPVAYSGEDDLCEQMAMLAPEVRQEVATGASDGTMHVREVNLDSYSLLLVSRSRDASFAADRYLERASRGVERILAI